VSAAKTSTRVTPHETSHGLLDMKSLLSPSDVPGRNSGITG
jgi:hypothetical protein